MILMLDTEYSEQYIYSYSRVNFTYLGQAQAKIQRKRDDTYFIIFKPI